MLSQLHILLTYTCPFECDHCFVYSSPTAEGTLTIGEIERILQQATAVPTIRWIYFEGGEAFLFHPLLVEAVRRARSLGFEVGIVTSGYFAATEDDAELWLRPLAELGIRDLSVSDDAFHHDQGADNPARRAMRVAQRLGVPTGPITLDPALTAVAGQAPGEPVAGGRVMFRGRAVDRLTEGLPLRPWQSLDRCPYEELEQPERIHLDPFGNLHICQGISIGNVGDASLAEILEGYEAGEHRVCGPLIRGGPAELARAHGVEPAEGYVDECHLCFEVRRALLDRLPEVLNPPQVYGIA
jgi:hypothetical protein